MYTSRGDFPEYEILVEAICRWLAAAYVSNSDLAEGRLKEPLEAVVGRGVPAPPDLGGADRAARRLLEILEA